MVRNYVKKTKRDEIEMERNIQAAILLYKEGSMGYRDAAKQFGIKHTTLFYRIKKLKNVEGIIQNSVDDNRFNSKYTVNQIFSKEQEEMLVKYILRCSQINYGMTLVQIRKLAYDYAVKVELKIPDSWKLNLTAGNDWLYCFMKRHPSLSIRKPEKTSLSRATSFNKTNVMFFFDLYEKALKKYPVTPDRIYNIDETGVSTVVDPPNVVAQKGVRQVGQNVSAERGQMITACMTINAVGQSLPPVFIFPRVRMSDLLMIGAPDGSLGLPNSTQSAWINSALFVKVLEHIKNHTRCTNEDKILLLMDNHESHCSLEAVSYAKENGIVLVTFPPHCTHKLQPLDVGVFGPFKSKLKIAQNDWLTNNPGKTIRIHDLPSLTKIAFIESFSVKTIVNAFSKPGIWPFSRLAFSEDDFAAAYVTDRPDPNSTQTVNLQIQPDISISRNNQPNENVCDFDMINSQTEVPTFTDLLVNSTEQCCTNINAHSVTSAELDSTIHEELISPEHVRPFPKAAPRVERKGGRKKGKARILTETPEKIRIEQETREIKTETSCN